MAGAEQRKARLANAVGLLANDSDNRVDMVERSPHAVT